MRTFLMILVFLGLFTILFANPIAEGPYISELYWDGENWQIELYNQGVEECTLDNCALSTSSGMSEFFNGIEFYDLIVVSIEDLLSPLEINLETDTLITYYDWGNGFQEIDFFIFYPTGYWNYSVNGPEAGQSLRRYEPMMEYGFILKDASPTVGEQNDLEGCTGIFQGYVYDIDGNPLNNAEIKFYRNNPILENIFPYLHTNEQGYFSGEIYAKNYEVSACYYNWALIDTFLTVEPDTTTYCEFYLDYTSVEDKEISSREISLSNYPNPFYLSSSGNAQTTISFSTTNLHENARIVIYNQKGQKVIVLECINCVNEKATQSLYSIKWNGRDENGKLVNSGVCFYTLEIDGKEAASNKMIVLR